jgi:putative endonuclease
MRSESHYALNLTRHYATLRDMLPKWLQSWIKPPPPKDSMGDRGENLAARFLRNLGYRIIIRNFRCEVGEIDIIARDGTTLVFVEVKTRAYDDPSPEDQVNAEKQRQISRVAKMYLSRYGTPRPAARFDVVAVIWPEGRSPIIRHVPHAFEAS